MQPILRRVRQPVFSECCRVLCSFNVRCAFSGFYVDMGCPPPDPAGNAQIIGRTPRNLPGWVTEAVAGRPLDASVRTLWNWRSHNSSKRKFTSCVSSLALEEIVSGPVLRSLPDERVRFCEGKSQAFDNCRNAKAELLPLPMFMTNGQTSITQEATRRYSSSYWLAPTWPPKLEPGCCTWRVGSIPPPRQRP